MKSRISLTKKDLFVCLCCAVFVFANLGAIGSRGRSRAKERVCLSILLRLGRIIESWAEDHDDYFPQRGGGSVWGEETMGAWPYVISDYLPGIHPKVYLCPAATKPVDEGGTCPFAAWYHQDQDRRTVASYACNLWAAKADDEDPKFWETFHVTAAAEVPLLLDGMWKDAEPEPSDEPPPSKEWIQANCWEPNRNEMKRVCHYRHESMVNGVFLDLSGRKIGLKELWVLKWHRQWPEGRDHLPDWEIMAPWMTNFKDY